MALQGTIQDFALPDIFQLIGIQRKTGMLTLDNGKNCVTIKFLDGQVVGADTTTETLEDRLGCLLVRTGRITEDQLNQALRVQQKTLQRLGHILVQAGAVSDEALIEALRLQSAQIIFRLFRWREARYRFASAEAVEYDETHFTPISAETILMEGARMIDEWPIIERRIRSPKMVLRRTALAAKLVPDATPAPIGEEIDFALSFDADHPVAEPADAPERLQAPRVSPEERTVLALVDGRTSVDELSDRSGLGEFDTCRILSDLMTRNLVEEASDLRAKDATPDGTRWSATLLRWSLTTAMALVTLLTLATLPRNPLTPWRIGQQAFQGDRLGRLESLSRLERIERAVQVFYLETGQFPDTLGSLATNGYIDPHDLQDGWGHSFSYTLSSGGYRIESQSAPALADQLVVDRRFNSVQQMIAPQRPATHP